MKEMTREERNELERLEAMVQNAVTECQNAQNALKEDPAIRDMGKALDRIFEKYGTQLDQLIDSARKLGEDSPNLTYEEVSFKKGVKLTELNTNTLDKELNSELFGIIELKREALTTFKLAMDNAKPTFLGRIADFFIGIANLFGAKIETYQAVAKQKEQSYFQAKSEVDKIQQLIQTTKDKARALFGAQAEFSFFVGAHYRENENTSNQSTLDQNTPLDTFSKTYFKEAQHEQEPNDVSPADETAVQSTEFTVAVAPYIQEEEDIPELDVSEKNKVKEQSPTVSELTSIKNKPQESRDASTEWLLKQRLSARGGVENENDIDDEESDDEFWQQNSPQQAAYADKRSPSAAVTATLKTEGSQKGLLKVQLITPFEMQKMQQSKKLESGVLYVTVLEKTCQFYQLDKQPIAIKIDSMPGDHKDRTSLKQQNNISPNDPRHLKIQQANEKYLSEHLDSIVNLIENQRQLENQQQLKEGVSSSRPAATIPGFRDKINVLSAMSEEVGKRQEQIKNVTQQVPSNEDSSTDGADWYPTESPQSASPRSGSSRSESPTNKSVSSTETLIHGLSRSKSNSFDDKNSTPRDNIVSSTLTTDEKTETKNRLLSIQLAGQDCHLVKSDTFNPQASQDDLKRLVNGSNYAIILNHDQLYYISMGLKGLKVTRLEQTVPTKAEFNQIKDLIANFTIETGLSRKATPEELPLAVATVSGWKKPPQEIAREAVVAASAENRKAGTHALIASSAEINRFKGILMACQGVFSASNKFLDAKSEQIATVFREAIQKTNISKNTFDGDLNEVTPNILQFYSLIRPHVNQDPQLFQLYSLLNKIIKDDGQAPKADFVAVKKPAAQVASSETQEAPPSRPVGGMSAGLLSQIQGKNKTPTITNDEKPTPPENLPKQKNGMVDVFAQIKSKNKKSPISSDQNEQANLTEQYKNEIPKVSENKDDNNMTPKKP